MTAAASSIALVIPRRAGLTAAGILELMNPKFAEAQLVPTDDKRIKTEWVEIDSPKGYGKIKAYVVKPANATGKLPTVLVIHENRGLNPHIEDVARRLALDGFLAVAPDALTPLGGYPKEGEDKARELFPKLDQTKTREDFIAATNYGRTRPDSNGKIGAVGFCYGGGMVSFLATRVPELAAGVSFYGGAPAPEDVKNIKAAMLILHAARTSAWSTAGPRTRPRSRRQRSPRGPRLPRRAARLQQQHHRPLNAERPRTRGRVRSRISRNT